MNGNERQAYDRGTSLYSPDGRIYQVEYAREAVSRGAPAVGVRTEEGVVLAAVVKARSSLQVEESVEKLHEIDEHIGTATAGHAADARRLVDIARQTAQRERIRYGESIDPDPLVTAIADQVQEYTQSGGTRPFGAALLVGSYHEDESALYALGPEGVPETWRAAVIGAGGDDIRSYLEDHYDADAGVDAAVGTALAALDAGNDDLSAEDVVVAVVDDEGYRQLSTDDVTEAFPDADDAADETDE
ncbi:MAG: archaeal proteasome endopeptidase complex subunit alpha [Haloferacaceae archaeon]